MERQSLKLWAAAVLSAGLLELPFPIAGPLPPWRAIFAWFGLVPLLLALLSQNSVDARRPLRRGFLLGYLCGVLWYAGNCYWIYDTMLIHGGLPPAVSALLLLGFSLVLGLYFGFFGLCMALVRRATGSTRIALAAAPFLWTALELAGARITCVPWDQLGYSQVDNALVNQLAPWTGVYGISFLIVVGNALLASNSLIPAQQVKPGQPRWRLKALLGREVWRVAGLSVFAVIIYGGTDVRSPKPEATATAVLVQPNLDVAGDNNWSRPGEWQQHIAEYAKLSNEECKTYIAGIPETNAPSGEIVCPPYATHPDLVAWPESPAPFFEGEQRFTSDIPATARSEQAPLVVGNIGWSLSDEDKQGQYYNSALVIGADGARVGRYDKIHLVPYGEYIPYKDLFSFAHKLTGKVSEFTRGDERKVFILPTQNGQRHRYGVFICYEAVFADEVREFTQLGAEVLVNISDDGWYGDTSAPWQHLNMARMRAIENRRWILRDTNNGVTASIDPYGTVRQSIPRHAVDALPAQFGFRDDITFYTAHGDVFAWACAALSIVLVGWAGRRLLRSA
jgi:apolipoprotein N-acyltransferase